MNMHENESITEKKINLPHCWLDHLREEFNRPYMLELKQFLLEESKKGKIIYPKGEDIFRALKSTLFEDVKVVIIGQDPYHGPGQAHGLSFSVPESIPLPPSLQNIYKEIKRDLNLDMPMKYGNLQSWAKQGVLLLNSVLTVEHKRANSHQGKGWESFTDAIIASLNQHREELVFLLWGSYAQKKGQMINRQKHLVLTSAHPSPLSAHRGFIGNNHFSKTNAYLRGKAKEEIKWQVKADQF